MNIGSRRALALFVFLVLAILPAHRVETALSAAPRPSLTISDLTAAYQAVVVLSSEYGVFAQQADVENHSQVGRLFRATAESERIQARNYAAVLELMGAPAPFTAIRPPLTMATPPQTARHDYFMAAAPGRVTQQNIAQAIKDETSLRDVFCPSVVQDALAEGQEDAARATTYAMNDANQHIDLLTAARWEMGRESAPLVSYYVSPVCGATFASQAPERCPVCGTPRSLFVEVT